MELATPELSTREVKYFSAMAALVMEHGSEGLKLTRRDLSALAEAMRERVFDAERISHSLEKLSDVEVMAVQFGDEIKLLFFHVEMGQRCMIGSQLIPPLLNA